MAESVDGENVRVLVVDDEVEVADAYALRLRGYCEVETAYGGKEALSTIEETSIDIVLLDRHMPGLSGDDVLEKLERRKFHGRVVMVTAVDPSVEVLEMPFDDYLCKPVEREDVRTVINQQRQILAFETLGDFFGLEAKRAIIEAEMSPEQRRQHDQYVDVAEQAERLERRVRRLMNEDRILDQFKEINRENI